MEFFIIAIKVMIVLFDFNLAYFFSNLSGLVHVWFTLVHNLKISISESH